MFISSLIKSMKWINSIGAMFFVIICIFKMIFVVYLEDKYIYILIIILLCFISMMDNTLFHHLLFVFFPFLAFNKIHSNILTYIHAVGSIRVFHWNLITGIYYI